MDIYSNLPCPRKPKLCVWTDLNVQNMDQILKCESTTETRNFLQRHFAIETSPRNDILLDLYGHALAFAKLQKFTKEQTSTFFSIIKQTHEVCVSSPFGNVEECFSFFRELVLTHSTHRPPWSLEIFSPEQVETLTNHAVNTYFRHYKLYKYAFTPKVRLDIAFNYDGLAPTPPPEPAEESLEMVTAEGDDAKTETPLPNDESRIEEVDEAEEKDQAEVENANELENIVRKAVGAQLKQMHLSVERQLEETDKVIGEKIHALEVGRATPTKKPRSPKGSGKKKK